MNTLTRSTPRPPGTGTTVVVVRRHTRRADRRQLRRRRGGARLRATLAIAAAALLITPYAAAPYLASLPTAAASDATGAGAAGAVTSVPDQLLAVPKDAPAASAYGRGDYTVTRVLPGKYRPYSSTADTFVNNPASPVQWPFTQGVPIRTWFKASHLGLDMNPGAGTPVQAIADGVVVETGNPSGTYGVYAVIEHNINGQKVTSLYGHMQEGSLAVNVGDTVTVAQLVGQVGSSGRSTGAHLHLSIRVGEEPVDPYAWLKQAVQL